MRLAPALLTPSGRPVLQPGEVECSLLDKVDLEFQPLGGLPGQQAEAYKGGYAILTTRRLMWVDGEAKAGDPGRTLGLPLSSVSGAHRKVAYGIKGSKVRLMLDVYVNVDGQPVPATSFHVRQEQLALRCRGSAPDAFKEALERQLPAALEADASAAPAAAASPAKPPAAGALPGQGAAALPSTPTQSSMGGLAATYSPLAAGLAQRKATASPAAGAGLGPAADAKQVAPGGLGFGVGAPPAAQGVQGSAGTGPSADRPDPALLQSMVEMGFPRNRCARSLLATRNEGLQAALDYLLAFGDQPGMDDPLDQPPAVTTPAPTASTVGLPPAAPWQAPSAGPSPYPSIYPPVGPAAAAPYGPPYGTDLPYGAGPYGGAGHGYGSAPSGSPVHASQPAYMQGLQQAMGGLGVRPMPVPGYSSAPDLQAAAAGGGAVPGAYGTGGLQPDHRHGVSEHGGGHSAIGVAGIVKREQQKTDESGRALDSAFQDLSALMASAATMVALAEKFRGVLHKEGSSGSGGGLLAAGEEDPLLLDRDAQQQLIALGISSPVTRETAGARYHIELSRQLADFLATPLSRCGGLLSLPDVYCLFNRARGTELVSPDDLLQAAKLFSQAGIPGLRLRPLSSGVLVIQGPQHSEERVCAKVAELAAAPPPPVADAEQQPQQQPQPALGPGLTASDVARALGGIALTIAQEHLLLAEARGVVCRDDGPEGLRFYANFFRVLDPASMHVYCSLPGPMAGPWSGSGGKGQAVSTSSRR